MNSELPNVKVDFYLSGPVGYDFDPGEITDAIGVSPSSLRTLEDWPDAIKHPSSKLPEGIGVHVSWSLSTETEPCRAISIPFDKMIEKLKGKESAINQMREKHNLRVNFTVVVGMEVGDGPEIFLEEYINSFAASINASIGFDLYIDEKRCY